MAKKLDTEINGVKQKTFKKYKCYDVLAYTSFSTKYIENRMVEYFEENENQFWTVSAFCIHMHITKPHFKKMANDTCCVHNDTMSYAYNMLENELVSEMKYSPAVANKILSNDFSYIDRQEIKQDISATIEDNTIEKMLENVMPKEKEEKE